MSEIEELREISKELTSLGNVMSLMQWDQEVMMPASGIEARGSQFALMSSIIHRRIVSPALESLLNRLNDIKRSLSTEDNALLRIMLREHKHSSKLPEKFVADFSRLTSQALPVWVKAKQLSDFSIFQSLLEKIVDMSIEKAEYLGYAEEPYDALLDLHEEGLLASEVSEIFNGLAPFLVEIINKKGLAIESRSVVSSEFELNAQVEFSEMVLKKIGYDFERGRQDASAHPFTTSLGHNDRRVTNRYHHRSLEYIFSALHEGGHALYEQGVAEELAETHLDSGVSLGIHESQSRLWENIIGRSLPFWKNYYPELQKQFPDQFKDRSLDSFYAEINAIRPGLIRVEADEVSYNLHVLARFELERELMNKSISVADLPALWNEKYYKYLGVSAGDQKNSDAQGVLQDIHWAHGSFGYFPTYTIGNLAAAQIWETYCKFDPEYFQTIKSGNLEKIRNWLTDTIYRHGAIYSPPELLKRVTGEKLNATAFINYISHKYGD